MSNVTLYAYIIGFNHNSEKEGSGISFGTFKTALTGGNDVALCDSLYNDDSYNGTKYFQMNHWGNSSNEGTNYGGWAACDMRYDILGSTDQAPTPYGSTKTTSATGANPSATCATNPQVNTTLMAALPIELRRVMKPITKYTDNKGGSGTAANVTATIDYLPLLSEYEVHGSAASAANQYEYTDSKQAQYQYYKNGNSKIKYKHNAISTACYWWVRSAFFNNEISFCVVNPDGNSRRDSSACSFGLAPIFLV